jgi:hypothetical protein
VGARRDDVGRAAGVIAVGVFAGFVWIVLREAQIATMHSEPASGCGNRTPPEIACASFI